MVVYQEGMLVGGSSRAISSSSYSLKEIIPERVLVSGVDISDSESVE